MALSEAGLVGSWVLVARAVPYKEFQRLLSHKIVPILNKVPFPYFQQLVWLVLEIKMEIDI